MKAFDQVWKSITGMPTTQLTRYRLVKAAPAPAGTFAPGLTPGAAVGESIIGVAYEPNTVGQPTQVVASGIAFCECGAAVADGAVVMTDATGRMIPYAAAAAAGENFRAGTALVGGAAAGAIGSILLN